MRLVEAAVSLGSGAPVAGTVRALREAPVLGHTIDLIPYTPAYHDALIALRNTDRASYYLHQPAPLTRAGQQRWYEGYLERDDDIQWIIARKDGTPVGGTALYGIAGDRMRAEKGRLVIDETRTREAPYVLEAELLLLDIAFDRLDIGRVDTCVRHDNATMQSINARLGFVRTGAHDIRGVEYFDYAASPARYHTHTSLALRAVPAAWARRFPRTRDPLADRKAS